MLYKESDRLDMVVELRECSNKESDRLDMVVELRECCIKGVTG